jgi:hypothetical protein
VCGVEMLDRALIFLRDELDSYVRQSMAISDSMVILNHLQGADGALALKNQNRLVITLIKIDYDSSRPYYNSQNHNSNQSLNGSFKKNAPQFFNINILISSNFDDYIESLKTLSVAIHFFQANNNFQRLSFPNLPEELNSLDVEIENSSEARSFDMWSALGAHYVPSIVYKIRRLAMDSRQIAGLLSTTRQTEVEIGT